VPVVGEVTRDIATPGVYHRARKNVEADTRSCISFAGAVAQGQQLVFAMSFRERLLDAIGLGSSDSEEETVAVVR
jgi:hypothetical protein